MSSNIRIGVDLKGPVRAIQQATMNLFADMGVQPTTRQEGLVAATASTDKTPPVSTGRWRRRATGRQRRLRGQRHRIRQRRRRRWRRSVGRRRHDVASGGRDDEVALPIRGDATAPAAAAMLSRAVDDSGNLEKR